SPTSIRKWSPEDVDKRIAGTWILTDVSDLLSAFPGGTQKKMMFKLSPENRRYVLFESRNAYSNAQKMDGYQKNAEGTYTIRQKEFVDTGDPYWEVTVLGKLNDLSLPLNLILTEDRFYLFPNEMSGSIAIPDPSKMSLIKMR
ncbi:MAG: hypothetical protein MK209_09705, partial [Planctomycetes bacterium]|nr:hypothetical protein [Planctomycetota bacterium]